MVAQTPSCAAEPTAFIQTSVVLERLQDKVPPGHFTLGWLMGHSRWPTPFEATKRLVGIVALLGAVFVPSVALMTVWEIIVSARWLVGLRRISHCGSQYASPDS